jgi:hypothetical protein
MRAFLLLCLAAVACGGTISDNGDAGNTGDSGTATKLVMTFAVDQIFLGETDRNGTPSTTAWKELGRNVDGLVSTTSSTDVCTRTSGAPLFVQNDGSNGNDNAWGAVIMPIIQTAASLSTPSTTTTAAIRSGAATFLIQVIGLDDTSSQTATGLASQVFMGASEQDAGAPAFDTTTQWPVASTSLVDGVDISSGALASFPSSVITNGAFDSRPGTGTIVWDMTFQGVAITLVIHAPEVTFNHVTNAAADGAISGVLDTQAFLDAMQAAAGRISQSLCGSAFQGIADQIQQAQDILLDGTNHAGTPCTGISIGLGFHAARIANPTTVAQVTPPPSPCP